jgi:TonB family protein
MVMVKCPGKISYLFWLLAILFNAGNVIAQQPQELCDNHPDLLLDEKGKPLRVKTSELMKRVIHCEIPKLPGNVCAKGNVIVRVLITPEGKVECAKAIHGHPLINKAALEAVKHWTFKPLVINNKPVAFLGLLSIYVSYDTRESKAPCQMGIQRDK